MRVKQLSVGVCPICDKQLFKLDSKGKIIIKNGEGEKQPEAKELWVTYNDGSNAYFMICNKCLEIMDLPMANDIQDYQRYTWGLEIVNNPMGLINLGRQIEWYIKVAVHLRVIKFARSKDGLTSTA